MAQAADIVITNFGTISTISATNTGAQAWLEENVVSDFGYHPVYCEHRYVGVIVEGAKEAGLIVSP